MDIFEEFTDTLAVTSFEPNDTIETASRIDTGQYEIQGNGVDWYRFDVDAGNMSFTMNQDDEARDLAMVLYNAAGNAIKADFTAGKTESFDQFAAADGTYYLRITTAQFVDNPPEDLQMTYTLNVSLPDGSVSDGNDVRENARDLEAGSHTIEGSAVDWFRVNSLSGEIKVNLRADADAVPQDLNLVIYNARGQAVSASQGATGIEEIIYDAPTAGEYYVKVFWSGAPNATSGGIKLDYTLDILLPEADVSQPDDTRDGAATLKQGSTTFNGSNVDWHKLDSLSGQVTLNLRDGPEIAGKFDDLDMVLYAADGTTVFESSLTAGTGVENISYVLPTGGEYYVKVFAHGFPDGAPNGSRLSYELVVDLPEEEVRGPNNPGETRETATLLTTGTQQVKGSGQDWFQIVTGPGEVTFAMTSTGGQDATSASELNMVLFDANGEQVQANNVNGGTEKITWLVNETGTYYLQVFAPAYPGNTTPNGVAMNYTLETKLPENTWSQQLDFGPVRTASVTAFDIDNDGKDEIFIGTSKALDSAGNEIRPGGLIVLEDDGTVKWTKTFAAIAGADSATGLTYNTTSVSTQAVFSDVNGDNKMDIIIGVGADNALEFGTPGQPGDKGGLYALDADGNELWFHQTKDVFGSALGDASDGPDGRSEGVYGTPRVFDIDGDGKREVLYTSWDHRLYIVDAATGKLEREFDLHDTASTTPTVADLDGDGIYEIIVPSDITDNPTAGIDRQGGILVTLSNYGLPNIDGWADQIFSTTSADFRGKFIDQALWSNAKVADIDNDGQLEIIHGTSNFFKDERGQFIKIWNADGTEQASLATNGQTLAAPLLADLDGDGRDEIIATTTNGYVYAWNADGSLVFETQPTPYAEPPLTGVARNLPIARQAIAVDIDNADGDLELILTMGSQTIVLDSDGTQLTSTSRADQVFNTYSGSPLVKDIDGDGNLDFVSGGTTEAQDQAVIYRWENPLDATGAGNVATEYRTAEYQNGQSLNQIQDFVERFYDTILGRSADAAGINYWTDSLATGVLSGQNIARGFINSVEFLNRGTSDAEYVNTLYTAFFNRPADTGGFNAWMQQLEGGTARGDVLNGFTGSREFKNLSESFGIRPELTVAAGDASAVIVGDANDTNTLRGAAGNQVISDESAAVRDPGSRKDITESGQVLRLYGATLGRIPDANGFLGWMSALKTDSFDIERVAGAFVNSQEFQNTYGALDNGQFVDLLYQNVLGRAADAAGRAAWVANLEGGDSRASVVLGFSNSGEYRARTDSVLDSFMREAKVEWNDVIEGGAGDDQMNGGIGSDLFIFRNGQGGNDSIFGFEPWDQLQLSGFGFSTQADAMAHMTQTGGNVVFNHAGQRIQFEAFTMAEMNRVRFNV